MSTDAVAHEGHPSHLAHHFDNPTQQYESGKLGMWLFLGTEILMFGGLFCAYAIFRANYPEIFHYGHRFLDVKMGGINTVVLICSSLTMAWAVRAAQLGQRMLLVAMLGLTLACAGGFMGIKYVEYKAKFDHGLLPGTHYTNGGEHGGGHGAAAEHGAPAEHGAAPAADHVAPAAGHVPPAAKVSDPALQPAAPVEGTLLKPPAAAPGGLAAVPADGAMHGDAPANPQIFFGIYFAMTGLHGIHVLAGMLIITVLMFQAALGRYGPEYFTPVDLVGLYWHIVDMIWIFLFPLLYLID